ncbi:PucR family transcriptional regulator [Clostridium uliginosum]|uniref:PucR C-terminal helix-turn-helix domain-containing protein n=1 Tax=Clostridium uliginosum TaxID=119641 RepID=A0A1I1L081_9CLOT|nr:helix-turn-helix domain-containing protein [Clostridium uliginosum]SFC64388.1 PucR C-terminal helix-turn-helix domain-containing protein [Clostridium uliginosum]
MNGLAIYLEELYKSCEIPFEVYINNDIIFKTNSLLPQNSIVENRFSIDNKIFIIQTYNKFKDSIKILKFCIENKCKEYYNTREKVIISLLKNEYVPNDTLEQVMFPTKDTYLIVIYLKEKISETIEILNDIYLNTDIIILEYKSSIVLVGLFEDIEEHISSITETIYINIYIKCYVSYCFINNYNFLKSLYEDSIYKIKLAKKYNLSSRVFNEKSLLFESVIDNLSEENKHDIVSKFNNGFSKLDEDTVNTIEIFFNCDLNLSEAAKKLFVHRNTLIYRLDKIKKYTSYDIKKFNEAILFKIAFFIWKEKK